MTIETRDIISLPANSVLNCRGHYLLVSILSLRARWRSGFSALAALAMLSARTWV